MNRLFSADGIRGVIGRPPLRLSDVERLGRAVAAWLRGSGPAPALLIGTDTRESSQRLKAVFIDGLTRGGVRIVDAGILPTAAISYLIASKGFFDAGGIVSASHNPIIENGIKLFDSKGIKLSDEDESQIEALFFGEELLPFQIVPAHSTQELGYAQQYAHALAREHRSLQWQACRIVVDCANGAAFQVGPHILDELGVPYALLNALPDGTNINRQAGSEYVRLNPHQLAAELRRYDAVAGFALDGDADRVVFVDHDGRLYDGDMMLYMLAMKLRHKGNLCKDTVVTTQMSNSGLKHFLRLRGIQTRSVQNGDKYVTAALLDEDLCLGGEQIGHVIVHTDRSRVTGDGLRTALQILEELVSQPNASLSDLARGMHKWPQVKGSAYIGYGPRVPPDEIPGLAALLHRTQETVPDLTRLECRPASTEPVYRIMLEARTTSVRVLARHTRRLAEHIQGQLKCHGQPIIITNCVSGGYIAAESSQLPPLVE